MLSITYTISANTWYFLKKQIFNITIFCLFCALISIIIQYMIGPNISELYCIYNIHYFKNKSLFFLLESINVNQKKILLHILGSRIITNLLNTTILYNLIMILIDTVISVKKKSLFKMIIEAVYKIPTLLPLIFLIFLLINIGLMFLELPGILLCILLPLAPIINFLEKNTLFSSIRKSIQISWHNIYVFLFPILLWLILRFCIMHCFFTSHVFPIYISIFISYFLNNFNFSFMIIYLFRLYTILQEKVRA